MKLKHTFFRETSFMFVSLNLVNLFNLLYNLIAVRFLSSSDFASLSTLLSLIVIITVPFAPFTTLVAKFSSTLQAKNEIEKLKVFFTILIKHIFIIATLVSFLIILFNFNIACFLKIDSRFSIIILSITLLFTGPTSITNGVLQGLQMFYYLGIASILASMIKPLLTFIFLKSSPTFLNAMIAFFIPTILSFILTIIPFNKYIIHVNKEIPIELKKKYCYLIPVVITSLCFSLLTNLDLILVKHYFAPLDAGFYAVSQMVGKVVLFLPAAINLVMFPKTSGLYAQDKETKYLLKRSLIYTSFLCLLVVLGYNLFPTMVLTILTGKSTSQYILLGRFFSMNMTIMSLLNLLLSYQLSINNFKFIKGLIFFTASHALLIYLFHQSLTQVLWVVFINSLILFLLNLRLCLKC